ncbi:MAG TPA: GreA/GreB family elongation factor [Cytophagaceae bacterium]
MSKKIILSKGDFVMLNSFIKNHSAGFSEYSLKKLASELQTAEVVEKEELPDDAIRLSSEVQLMETEQKASMTIKLVMPKDVDIKSNKISIFAPLGAALIGYRKGDTIEWEVPSGKKYYKILDVKN